MQLFTNNARSQLVSSITNVSLSLQVAFGDGAKFPDPVGSEYFLVTLLKVSGGIETAREIVKVTARSSDVFTIVRAQEGTTALAFAENDYVSLRLTAAAANNMISHINDVANPHGVTKTQLGIANVDNTSDANKPVSTATQTALDLKAPKASPVFSGVVGIGSTPAAGRAFAIDVPITGTTSSFGLRITSQVASDVTNGTYNSTVATTAAALTNLTHYSVNQSTLGGALTNQYGFFGASTLTGATNNYVFYADLASGSGRFNFYASGTAPNYFAGVTGVGITPSSTAALALPAGTTSVAPLRITPGVAPTAPTNGDMWTTGSIGGDALFIRLNGVTKQVMLA